jgi:hypothetical protein
MERPVAAETSPRPLYKGQEFSSLSEFKAAVADWAVKEHFTTRVVKSDK